jgi:hypothetical protein
MWLLEGTVEEVAHDTLHATPDGRSTHWMTRLVAKRFSIGNDIVTRIRRDHHLKPSKLKSLLGCLPGQPSSQPVPTNGQPTRGRCP